MEEWGNYSLSHSCYFSQDSLKYFHSGWRLTLTPVGRLTCLKTSTHVCISRIRAIVCMKAPAGATVLIFTQFTFMQFYCTKTLFFSKWALRFWSTVLHPDRVLFYGRSVCIQQRCPTGCLQAAKIQSGSWYLYPQLLLLQWQLGFPDSPSLLQLPLSGGWAMQHEGAGLPVPCALHTQQWKKSSFPCCAFEGAGFGVLLAWQRKDLFCLCSLPACVGRSWVYPHWVGGYSLQGMWPTGPRSSTVLNIQHRAIVTVVFEQFRLLSVTI